MTTSEVPSTTVIPASGGPKDPVLLALRLGWAIAETRGRNRPGGPLGATVIMPGRTDRALPLRIERSPSELRIQTQAAIEALATDLGVDNAGASGSNPARFSKLLEQKARLLWQMRAPKAYEGLQRTAWELRGVLALQAPDVPSDPNGATTEAALQILKTALAAQLKEEERRRIALERAKTELATAQKQVTDPANQGDPAKIVAKRAKVQSVAQAGVDREELRVPAEARGSTLLGQAVVALEAAMAKAPDTAAGEGLIIVDDCLATIATGTKKQWQDLADLIWRFDAHIQDALFAASEAQASAYQLGRGLAETYWALDPFQDETAQSWQFLLGDERCSEMERLMGRLCVYMGEFTAPAVVGSIEIWKEVAQSDDWHANRVQASTRLYAQIRRWYELVIVGQDPTTLIRPYEKMSGYRTVFKALDAFKVQLFTALIGLAGLVTFWLLLGVGAGSTVEKTISGMLAAAGFSLAGITGSIKNSAQAAMKRLRQDAYTELVALAVQTSPSPPPKGIDLQEIINRRKLTPPSPPTPQ